MGSRDPSEPHEGFEDTRITSFQEAADTADLVVLALPYLVQDVPVLLPLVEGLSGLDGEIIVDVSNPLGEN